MVEKRSVFEYRTAGPFEYWTNGHHLIFLCTGPVLEWLVKSRVSQPGVLEPQGVREKFLGVREKFKDMQIIA